MTGSSENTPTWRIEALVSRVLRIGVSLSAAIIIIGLIIIFAHFNNQTINPFKVGSFHKFTASNFTFPHSPGALFSGLISGSGLAYIELGILLLILTPILRVAVSSQLFLATHDKRMAYVTVFVLLVLLSSFGVGIAVR